METVNTKNPRKNYIKLMLCKYCRNEINNDATVCHHCKKPQKQNFFLESVQHFSIVLTFVLVLISGLQAYVSYLQMEESKQKRVEATNVLEEAQEVLKTAELKAQILREDARVVLDEATNQSIQAIDKSKKALSQAKHDVATAMIKVKNTERKVSDLHGSLTSFKKDSESTLATLDNEVNYLTERNEITKLADNAISDGNAQSFRKLNTLRDKYRKPPGEMSIKYYDDLLNATLASIVTTKLFYATSSRIHGIHITWSFIGQTYKDSEIPTQVLIKDLPVHQHWSNRAKIASLLGEKKEKGVPEVLLKAAMTDNHLEVQINALRSLSKITGYKSTDILNGEEFKTWWGKNKHDINTKLENSEPIEDFINRQRKEEGSDYGKETGKKIAETKETQSQ